MTMLSRIALALIVLSFALRACAGEALPRATPESQGVSSAQVRAFVEEADAKVDTMHSFMVVRHGKVVAEGWWKPESADKPHVMHSLSKSFTSTAIGFAVSEGKLSIDDPVMKYFTDVAPAGVSENLKKMRIRDLLIMSTGHRTKADFTDTIPWAQTFMAQPVEFKPGTHFMYNSPGSYMLSAIVQKVTGQTALDYLRPRLFEPLDIDNPQWLVSPQGVSTGGWGLSLRTEDVAKFGLLYLNKGRWGQGGNGKQLLPESWVELATTRQTSTGSDPASDWDQGYGFQFWRSRNGAYRGDGAFGQFCIVLPDKDAVIAITADDTNMQGILDVVWDKLLPAFGSDTLPENAKEQERLNERVSKLAVRAGHRVNVINLPGSPTTQTKRP